MGMARAFPAAFGAVEGIPVHVRTRGDLTSQHFENYADQVFRSSPPTHRRRMQDGLRTGSQFAGLFLEAELPADPLLFDVVTQVLAISCVVLIPIHSNNEGCTLPYISCGVTKRTFVT